MYESRSSFPDTQPHPARIYDSLLGGKDNYVPDQKVADELSRRWPEIREGARDNRAWMHRTVRTMASEGGIRQFLDLGSGIPTRPNLHEVAAETVPDARVVYVDNDPVVTRHAEAMLGSGPGGARTVHLQADVRDVEALLAAPQVRDTLDLGQPLGLVLGALLHFLSDEDEPQRVLDALTGALAPGSYVALSHACPGGGAVGAARAMEAAAFYRENKVSAPFTVRTQGQIEDFFTGLELLEPGVVPVASWRPDPDTPVREAGMGFRGGLAVKKA